MTSSSAEPIPSRVPWPTAAWFSVLLLLCYAPTLRLLVRDWIIDDDMSHGFLVPLVAGYILWLKRDELLSRRYSPDLRGLLLVGFAALQLFAGTLGAELFMARTSFLIALAGIVMTLGGVPLLRSVLFPLVLLCFMIPIPAIIYNQITFPLQIFASQVAETGLSLLGIPVLRDGNILDLPQQRLFVVEACSGIRSLLSLSFLSLVYAYFFDSRPWMRWVLLAATIPIAVLANSGRVTITGILSEYKPELAQGFFHSAEGWVIFMIALVLMIGTHRILIRIFAKTAPAAGANA